MHMCAWWLEDIIYNFGCLAAGQASKDTCLLFSSQVRYLNLEKLCVSFLYFYIFSFWRLHHLILFHPLYNYLWISSSKHSLVHTGCLTSDMYPSSEIWWIRCWTTEQFLLVLKGFVRNLLNTTVMDFLWQQSSASASQLKTALFARWISLRDSHGFACAFGFCWKTVGIRISTLIK